MNRQLLIWTPELNKLREVLETNKHFKHIKIIEMHYESELMDLWRITFNQELTLWEAFELGKESKQI
jgi:hypothetical protein